MMWNLNRHSDVPLYRQIVEWIEQRITYGELPPDSMLPSERKLAEQLDVNRSTVVQAYDELRAAGLIERVRGSGTRVRSNSWNIDAKRTPNWREYIDGGMLPPSPPFIRRIRDELRRSDAIIDVASGEMGADMLPQEEIRAILRDHSFDDYLGYCDPYGYGPLREIVASHLSRSRGIQATPSSVLITSGSQQSLYLITQCLLSPGDSIAIEDPSYCYSLPIFRSAGLKVFGLPVDDHGVIPEAIADLDRKHRLKMIFVNPNHHNPTGTVLEHSRRVTLLSLAERFGIPIVEDDAFGLNSFGTLPPASLKSMDGSGIVIYIGTMSKVAASGLRIGWLVAPQSIVDRLSDARQQMDYGHSIVPQKIAAHFIDSDYFWKHVDKVRDVLQLKRDLMVRALHRELPGAVDFHLPQGGFHLWMKLNSPVSEAKLRDEAMKRGVAFVPGCVFGSATGYARMNFARPYAEDIERGIARFASALRSLTEHP
ncbi:PLP-dependent aminotransferase family protein [Paenibacillus profundus]|uniref:PLP-dependent aminotransferase family protein n=1 Tax=Paenibacillus profundus TaxID=1173085 RepID=A0ABS8YIA7_9BACL|nr:PLP-dependent aminotransferase family protein [Paenibacillus profundus]MCE5169927.1 PLP-dependent aminotransferase family protein [Paenibacillus profundus]